MTVDFAMLSPEVNSARMYSGAGSGPMVAAASAWKALAAELRSTALSYWGVLSGLTDEEWHGPASAAMAEAAMPYVEWMNATAIQAEETAAQAEAAVAAYTTAFSVTVPPPQIATNRARLASLVSTNVIGQNTPAIAATEAEYGEMWAQDAAAMYGYAGSSAVASRLTPFDPPQETSNPSGASAQSAAVGQATATSAGTGAQSTLSKLMSSVPGTLHSMASPASSTTTAAGSTTTAAATAASSSWMWDNFGPNANIWNTIFSSGFYMPGNYMGTAADFMSQQGGAAGGAAAGAAEGAAGAAAGAAEGAAGVAAPLGGLGAGGCSVAAGLGTANLVGPLSVPTSWTGAAPATLSTAIGATPMVAPPPAMAAGMPGIPIGGAAGRGFRSVPQYGFKPTFITRPPSAG